MEFETLLNNSKITKDTKQFWNKDIYFKKINCNKEIILTWFGIAVTFFSSVLVFSNIGRLSFKAICNFNLVSICGLAVFFGIIIFLIYGNVLYQFTRIGYFKRLKLHNPEKDDELDAVFKTEAPSPSLTFLIPSYKEEIRIIKQSILSTALQEYPDKRIVLLIDDQPHPTNPDDWNALASARNLPKEIERFIVQPKVLVEKAFNEYTARLKNGHFNVLGEAIELCAIYDEVSQWFLETADQYEIMDHTDELFVKITFLDSYKLYSKLSEELGNMIFEGKIFYSQEKFYLAYKRLVSRFSADITSFERKRYENLSHELNKAMNLNSYIGLLGKNIIEVRRDNKLYLQETEYQKSGLRIPSADFIITLDADSFLSYDYALRLIYLMQKKGNEDIAVAQTPYSAVPNPPGILERIAGATTDMQYLIHQGFTYFNSTFWVGANALLRTKALYDICEEAEERGHKIKIFIQDRTVIEDTESSVDLRMKGWRLFNYPQRLSYSATPPDFGALLIQRRRWANGGLIILPKLLRNIKNEPLSLKLFQETFMRTHYLISITAVNIGLPIIMVCHFDGKLNNIWLPFTALPYYFFYGRDLLQAGYKFFDLFRVYALNLILVPINLGGVFKSIHQLISKQKIPFKRTPKISGRTMTPASYLIIEYVIILFFILGFIVDCINKRFMHAAFSLLNSIFFIYAIVKFIGLTETYEDIFQPPQKPVKQKSQKCLCDDCNEESALVN